MNIDGVEVLMRKYPAEITRADKNGYKIIRHHEVIKASIRNMNRDRQGTLKLSLSLKIL